MVRGSFDTIIERMTNQSQWPLLNNSQPASQYQAPGGPAPDAPVSETERDRAERLLHQAHREGRITTTDFEDRFTRAMNAVRLDQLYAAIQNIPAPRSQAMVPTGGYYQRGYSSQQNPQGARTPVFPGGDSARNATLTHLSGALTWIFGPLIVHSSARPGSVLRREAAKAFNFQLIAGGVFVAAAVVFGILGLGNLMGLVWLGWLGLTVAGAVKAGNGEDWTNPLTKVTKVTPLDPGGR